MTWFFFIVTDTCEEKNSTVALEKCDSIEWLFNYHFFCLTHTLLGHIPVVTIFVGNKRVYILPYFPRLFTQFPKTVLVVRNELTLILTVLANWKFGISNGFCNLGSCSCLFWTVQPSTYFWHFLTFQPQHCQFLFS